jgi:hypothetical protein
MGGIGEERFAYRELCKILLKILHYIEKTVDKTYKLYYKIIGGTK